MNSGCSAGRLSAGRSSGRPAHQRRATRGRGPAASSDRPASPTRCSTTHFSMRRGLGQRLVDVGLQRDHLAAPVAAVGGDAQLGLAVVDAVAQRLGREAAEHHGVGRADARAGQHGDGRLGHHRHVDGHPVAALRRPACCRALGEPADLGVQLAVGEHPLVARLALPDDGRLVAACWPGGGRGSWPTGSARRPRTTSPRAPRRCSTFWNGLVQASSARAISPQNPSGSSIDWRYRRW